MNFDLAVIIPAYNEAGNIRYIVESLILFLSTNKYSYEILVVDDGSVDDTSNEIIQIQKSGESQNNIRVLRNSQNCGKGYSVKHGVMESDAEVVLFMDADLAYDLDTIKKMDKAVKMGNQVVIGSRNLPESKMNADVPILRFISGKVYSYIIQVLMFKGISDTQCGIKCFDGRIVKRLFENLRINDFGFDVELLYIAKKYKYSILSIPVTMIKHRKESRVNVFSDSIRMFIDLFIIRWNDLIGKY